MKDTQGQRDREYSGRPGGVGRAVAIHARTDPVLMNAIRDTANHEAWKSFERRYATMVRSYCVARGMRVSDAEDVSQEVFLRMTKHGFIHRYDPTAGTFRSYLFRVTRSVASGIQQSRAIESNEYQQIEYTESEWDRVWKQEAVRLAIRSVEAAVSERAKQILSLTIRGVAPSTIAELTCMDRDAVYKARERLRAQIELACKEFMLDPREI